MSGINRLTLIVVLFTLLAPNASAQTTMPSSDVILEWNQVMLDANAADSRLLIADQPGPTGTSRAFAIVSVAMFDAWNSIYHKYNPYLTELNGYNSANLPAAVSTAARDTLIALYPQQAATFRTACTRTMLNVPAGTPRTKGIDLGKKVALAILANRSNDNSKMKVPYIPSTDPGNHQPDPLHPGQGFHGPHWGFVTPFAITDMHSHLAAPPPSLDSFEYAVAYQALANFGGEEGQYPTLRGPKETITGIFWAYDGTPGLGTPPRLYNQVVRVIAARKNNSVEANARLFALINIAMADAGIQCWYSKYHYNLWRPVVGIRNAANDTNEFTIGDPAWRPMGAPATNRAGDGVNFTPPFPAYPSGHSTFGAAAFGVTSLFYGTSEIRFSFTSDEYNGVNRGSDGKKRPVVTRTYNNLEDATYENAFSRIYLGIHWPFDATEGMINGKTIAKEVYSGILRPKAPVR